MTATMTPPSAERITLYYRQGASDKVYQAALEPRGEGFVVHFAFGRRGSTLNTGTKTASPVDYEAAKRIYDKLVREKTAKGYTPGQGRHALPAHPKGGPRHRHPAPVVKSSKRGAGRGPPG